MSLLSSFREKMVVLLSYHNFNACAVGFTKWNSKKYEMVEKWRCSPPWGCLSLSLLVWLNDNADGFLQGWSPAPNHTRPRTRSATIPLGSNLSARLCRYPSCYSLWAQQRQHGVKLKKKFLQHSKYFPTCQVRVRLLGTWTLWQAGRSRTWHVSPYPPEPFGTTSSLPPSPLPTLPALRAAPHLKKMPDICQIEVSIHVEPAIWHPDLLAARNLVAAGWLPGDWMTARQPCQIDSRENLQGNEG